jgi:hypothetical protein
MLRQVRVFKSGHRDELGKAGISRNTLQVNCNTFRFAESRWSVYPDYLESDFSRK